MPIIDAAISWSLIIRQARPLLPARSQEARMIVAATTATRSHAHFADCCEIVPVKTGVRMKPAAPTVSV